MAQLFANNAVTTLASSIVAEDMSLVVTSGSTFPIISTVGDYFYLTLSNDLETLWEEVKVTATSSNTFTIARAQDNTSAQSWGAGSRVEYRPTAQIFRDIIAGQREKLTAARTYYTRTDGSDSNTGLANTAGGAFLTVQKMLDTISGAIDMGPWQVTGQIADGTYAGNWALKPYVGQLAPIIQGNTTTPANVSITGTAGVLITSNYPVTWSIKGIKISTSGSYGFASQNGSQLSSYNIEFGTVAGPHMYAAKGGTITLSTNYVISGNATYHHYTDKGGVIICAGRTVTITNTPAFTAFAFCDSGWQWLNGNTYSGSATGKRFVIDLGGQIQTASGSLTYLPGDAAGTNTNGGYDNVPEALDAYLSTETLTGKTWLGNPVYRKVISCGALPNATSKSVAHGISSPTWFLPFSGSASTAAGAYLPLPHPPSTNVNQSITVSVDGTNVNIATGIDRTADTSSYVILEYTK